MDHTINTMFCSNSLLLFVVILNKHMLIMKTATQGSGPSTLQEWNLFQILLNSKLNGKPANDRPLIHNNCNQQDLLFHLHKQLMQA